MKLKYVFEYVDMGDEIIAVPIGDGIDDIKGVLKLNKEAQIIIEYLNEETSVERIVNDLSNKYESSYNTLSGYVKKVIDVLRDNCLLLD